MKKPVITYISQGKEMPVREEENLLELCLHHDIPIDHECEGGASCGTCRVIVESSVENLPERNLLEQDMAEDRDFQPQERLACQLGLGCPFTFRLPRDQKN